MLSADVFAQEKQILIFGDSITAGFGLEEQNAFPAFIQQKIDSLDMDYNVVNAGLSGETSAGGLRRIDWVLQQPVDIFILELGGNDGLRGIDPENTKQNLQGIIQKVEEKYPGAEIILTGMEAPPNMGERYTGEFRSVFYELADENDVIFMPFILEGVAGDPELNQGDGIHPTEEGHKVIAENLWDYLKEVL
jgi:acyl-CoA thioesterase-1